MARPSACSRVLAALALLLALLPAACTTAIPRHQATIGIDPMPEPGMQQRLLINLAAVPRFRVIDLSVPRNAWAFDADRAETKLRLAARTEPGPLCIDALYTQWSGGLFRYRSSLGVARTESDDAETCLARFALRLEERLYPARTSPVQQPQCAPEPQ